MKTLAQIALVIIGLLWWFTNPLIATIIVIVAVCWFFLSFK